MNERMPRTASDAAGHGGDPAAAVRPQLLRTTWLSGATGGVWGRVAGGTAV